MVKQDTSSKKQKRKGKWQYCKWFPDPKTFVIHLETDNHKRKEYYEILARLVKLIYEHESKIINYAHLPQTIATKSLPLVFESKHKDITFISREGHLVFLTVDVVQKEKVPKYVRRLIWRKEQ